MYLRRKCYSSLYDDLYNDYLYDKYFSDLDDYDYYDQREFAMNPAEMAKLMYRTERNLMGKDGLDKLENKMLEKLRGQIYNRANANNPKYLSKAADISSDFITKNSPRIGNKLALRDKKKYIDVFKRDFSKSKYSN